MDRALLRQRQGTGHFSNDIHEFGPGRNDDLGIFAQGLLYRLEFPQQLRIAHEVGVGGLIDESYGLGFAFGGQDLGLLDPLGFLDFCAFDAIRLTLRCIGKISR